MVVLTEDEVRRIDRDELNNTDWKSGLVEEIIQHLVEKIKAESQGFHYSFHD